MATDPSGSYTYDANGNMLTKPDGTAYTWDVNNRLTQVTLPGTGGSVTFKYDPFGRRIQKSGPLPFSAHDLLSRRAAIAVLLDFIQTPEHLFEGLCFSRPQLGRGQVRVGWTVSRKLLTGSRFRDGSATYGLADSPEARPPVDCVWTAGFDAGN